MVKRLDEMRKQNHIDSMEDLQKAAEAQGVSFEDLKEQIREGVITQEVISQEVGPGSTLRPRRCRRITTRTCRSSSAGAGEAERDSDPHAES